MVHLRRHLILAVAATFLFAVFALAGDDWKPIDPSELAMKTGKVDKDADAEAIFLEARVVDQVESGIAISTQDYYVRIKILSDRGKEQGERKIYYYNGTTIKNLIGRTIKPDGTVVELRKEDVFDRVEEKVAGFKIQAKTFAMPSVEAGSIVEYRWREERLTNADYRLYLQLDDIPVEKITLRVKPMRDPHYDYGWKMHALHVLMQSPFQPQNDGFYVGTFLNMPAFKEEPRMPPNDQERAFLEISYTREDDVAPAQYWKAVGKRIYDENKQALKPNGEVSAQAAKLIGDASTPEQKLEKIFNFCHAKIKNVSDPASGISREEISSAKENKTPGDTLKHGIGDRHDINLLFGAMASAAGFEVRVAVLGDRSDIFFDPRVPSLFLARMRNIAVRVGNEWRYFDPGSRYVESGMLAWQQEGEQVLVSDSKEPEFGVTPLSPPEKSLARRTAKLKLTDDGNVEGDVRVEYTGHLAADRRNTDSDISPAEREKNLKEFVKTHWGAAEVSSIKIENADDLDKPYVYEYHIKVPNYATRTGKRLIIVPAFFQSGEHPVFTGSSRTHSIFFRFAWSEEDHVSYSLPSGFELDSPQAPGELDARPVGNYVVSIKTNPENTVLEYNRSFMFGGAGHVLFPVEAYDKIKSVFEGFNKRDNESILLKQTATASAANGN